VSREPVEVSVLVPVAEPAPDLVELYREFSEPLAAAGLNFEFVFVSFTWYREFTAPLRQLAEQAPIVLIELGHGAGETPLLRAGVTAARGRIICTLPPYRQTEAAVLPRLVQRVCAGADLAVACRSPRKDSLINRFQSRALHLVLRGATGGKLHDAACGVRAFRQELWGELRLYGDFARFLPVFALRDGFEVEEVPAAVHPGSMRARVHRPGVYLRRLVDSLGLLFLIKFTEKPLRLFGLLGAVFSLGGALILVVVLVQRLLGQGLADRPLLLLGVLLATVGIQLLALGLIGELIVHVTAARQRLYRVKNEDHGG
jgi:hypothetical protein